MRWKGPTNASNSIPILLGMALLHSVPSVHPHSNSSLFLIYKKKAFSTAFRRHWKKKKECRCFSWAELSLNSVSETYWLHKVRN